MIVIDFASTGRFWSILENVFIASLLWLRWSCVLAFGVANLLLKFISLLNGTDPPHLIPRGWFEPENCRQIDCFRKREFFKKTLNIRTTIIIESMKFITRIKALSNVDSLKSCYCVDEHVFFWGKYLLLRNNSDVFASRPLEAHEFKQAKLCVDTTRISQWNSITGNIQSRPSTPRHSHTLTHTPFWHFLLICRKLEFSARNYGGTPAIHHRCESLDDNARYATVMWSVCWLLCPHSEPLLTNWIFSRNLINLFANGNSNSTTQTPDSSLTNDFKIWKRRLRAH